MSKKVRKPTAATFRFSCGDFIERTNENQFTLWTVEPYGQEKEMFSTRIRLDMQAARTFRKLADFCEAYAKWYEQD